MSGNLEQDRIDYAFARACRRSRNLARFKDIEVCLLSGKNTKNAGVTDMLIESGVTVRLTNIERTLIDITVRPIYAGGVFSVLDAYREAYQQVSINKLAAMLKSIGFIYPYHQSIGFYLERAGCYSKDQIKIIDRFEKNYDFYLTHQIKDKAYSDRWRLYYPKGL